MSAGDWPTCSSSASAKRESQSNYKNCATQTDTLHSSKEAEARRRNELTKALMSALTNPNRPVQGETPTYPGTKIAQNTTYAPVSTFLDASDALIAEYQRVDNMSKDMQVDAALPVAETWNEEVAEAERRLKMGARVAIMNVGKVLGMPVDAGGEGHGDGDGDEEMIDADEEGEGEKQLSFEWQKSLQYMERGVKRMVKGLPEDEE